MSPLEASAARMITLANATHVRVSMGRGAWGGEEGEMGRERELFADENCSWGKRVPNEREHDVYP